MIRQITGILLIAFGVVSCMMSDKSKLIGYQVESDFLVSEFPSYEGFIFSEGTDFKLSLTLDDKGSLIKLSDRVKGVTENETYLKRDSVGKIQQIVFVKVGKKDSTVLSLDNYGDKNTFQLEDFEVRCNSLNKIEYFKHQFNTLPYAMSAYTYDEFGRCTSQVYFIDFQVDVEVSYRKYSYDTEDLIWEKRTAYIQNVTYDTEALESDYSEDEILAFPLDFNEKAKLIEQTRTVTPIYN